MSSLAENSKLLPQIEEAVLKKISQLMTKFHSLLLPKAKNSDVYRDLSQQQQYMLTNLESDNILHSILAGSLAVDSCITNMIKAQNKQGESIIKTLTSSLNHFNALEEEISQLSNWNTMKLLNNFGQSFKQLLKLIKQGSYSLSQENNGIISIDHEDQGSLIADLNIQNIKLKQKLADAQKQQVSLELKLMKIVQNSNHDENPHTKHEAQNYKQTIKRMRQQKNQLINELEKMEEEIRILSKYNDRNTSYILEELQYEIQCLKEEKRHDERIVSEIQMKIDMMCLARNTRKRPSIDGSLRSDLISPRNSNYIPIKSRIRRQNSQRPLSSMKKSTMVKRSNIFQHNMGNTQEIKQSIHLPVHNGDSFNNDNQINESNDSFMPRYSPRQVPAGLKPNIKNQYYHQNLNSNPKKAGKTLNRIRTTFL